MRITREDARRLGLDFDALWRGGTAVRPDPAGKVATVDPSPSLIRVASGPGWWVVEIANWHPCSDNLRARSVREWARRKARDRDVVREMLAHRAGASPATGRRKASLVVTKRCGRGIRDASNMLKSFFDSLKTCGLIVDDDEVWLDWARPRVVIDRELGYRVVSTITIEEMA